MSFSESEVQAVWEKGEIIPGNDPSKVRKDQCKALIKRSAYGDRQNDFGWEIDHISPRGSNSIYNLRPLHWRNNVAKSDGRLTCVVTAVGERNYEKSN